MTLAVFRVVPEHHPAFRKAWQALCAAFLGLPQPPSSSMTLIQSNLDSGDASGLEHRAVDECDGRVDGIGATG
jgi:hypothetical protein